MSRDWSVSIHLFYEDDTILILLVDVASMLSIL
jgi:hypothetical protein